MNWINIGWTLVLVAMFFMLLPRAMNAVKNSPKGSTRDWMGFIVPLTVVILFVILLIALV